MVRLAFQRQSAANAFLNTFRWQTTANAAGIRYTLRTYSVSLCMCLRSLTGIDLPSPSRRIPRDQIRTFAPRSAFHYVHGHPSPGEHPSTELGSTTLTESSRTQQIDGREGARVAGQTTQTQHEAGVVVVRRRVAYSATRVKSLHRRRRGLSGRKVRESASATLHRSLA